MPSRPNEYPRASTALAGLGLTTQLAAAATESIPIAKLVLGVVSRIITLAEDIETSRDALQQLAESARTMGLSISAVVAGRKLNPEVERRLEAIYEVLRSIETLFTRHKARRAFYKALSYAFTTKKRVESLSQELSRATQELLCIAVVDTNAQVREDSRYIGEVDHQYMRISAGLSLLQFRRIRICDVDDLKLIMEHKPRWTSYSSQIYSGRFEGRAVVLRILKQNPDYTSRESVRQQVIEHDRLLEDISTDPSLHINIARLYGPTISEFYERPATIDSTWNIISQLLDATIWLEDKGLSWGPDWPATAIFIDSAGAPIIGLNNDLRSCDAKEWHIYVLRDMLEHAYSTHWEQSQPSDHALDIIFGTAPVLGGICTRKLAVPRRLIPTLNANISAYIRNALQSLKCPYTVWSHTGAVILRAATSGCTVGSAFYTQYNANSRGSPLKDLIFLARVDESDEELIHQTVSVGIPTSLSDVFRKKLGITVEGPPDHLEISKSFSNPTGPEGMRFVPWL